MFDFCLVTQQEIVSLYERFCQLDRNGCGFISADEFLSVPEFAVNPLSQVSLFQSLFTDTHIFLPLFHVKGSFALYSCRCIVAIE